MQRPPDKPLQQDLSYGLYIYHWPVAQLLVVGGLAARGEAPFVAAALALALGLALASWHWIERPALAFKDARWIDRLGMPVRRRH